MFELHALMDNYKFIDAVNKNSSIAVPRQQDNSNGQGNGYSISSISGKERRFVKNFK